MNRRFLVCVVGTALVLLVQISGGDAVAQTSQGPRGLTFDGEVALLSVAINADKTSDFETILAKLHEGLSKSQRAERRQQAAGWKVYRMRNPLPDGTIAYVHLINPVVPGADYAIMQTLYDEFPNERLTLYEMYRGAFAKNLSLATGTIAIDLSKAVEVSQSHTQ